jgi:thymidylate synthase (FAD)
MKLEAKLIAYTQPVISVPAATPEDLVAFCARVSSGRDYEDRGKDTEGLLKYCIKNKHWSVFEMVNAVVEVKAPRDITRQLLRHRSFSFQEFSQRYSARIEFTDREFRKQDTKNRQNSIDSFQPWQKDYFAEGVDRLTKIAESFYESFREDRVAKECARVILPEGLTMSRLYVNGTLRSWLHYLDVRDDPGVTQWEHVLLARAIRKELEPVFPNIMVPKE